MMFIVHNEKVRKALDRFADDGKLPRKGKVLAAIERDLDELDTAREKLITLLQPLQPLQPRGPRTQSPEGVQSCHYTTAGTTAT